MDISVARSTVCDRTLPSHFRRGLFLLAQAHEYAAELQRDVWDFAVELSSLREAGLTNSDLRWLVCKEYVEPGHEVTPGESAGREFRRGAALTITGRTCFVLTPAGVRVAQCLLRDTSAKANGQAGGSLPGQVADESPALRDHQTPDPLPMPRWDRDRHEFRVGRRLVKVFKLPSPNQEAVLMAFEEEGWPPRIDDPLSPVAELDPKRRLHDTIKGLNRNQKNCLVRFMGDGTGEGVRWELRAASSDR